MVFERLGNTKFALETDERYFRSELADQLAAEIQTPVVPLLKTRGMAIAAGGKAKVNRVQIIGVDERFGKLGEINNVYDTIGNDEVIINTQLSSRLDLKPQDEVLLRLEKLDFLPKDAPLASESDLVTSRRLRVKGIVTNKQLGHFNLKASQVVPYTVFVSLSMLSRDMKIDNRANILLVSEKADHLVNQDILTKTLRQNWSVVDAGIDLIALKDQNLIELRSKRIFLEANVNTAALEVDHNAQQIFTYFVNSISSQSNATPYSFISAPQAPIVPDGMKDDEIIINSWLANDLNSAVGDSLTLAYYVLGPMRQLIEKHSRFCVKKIVLLAGIYADRELMPQFPGLADQTNCRDWQLGIPINLDKIRDKDEAYWDSYRGTPKGFVTLNAAQNMWQNRFGKLTAIRFKNKDIGQIRSQLSQILDPTAMGFHFRNVREEGLRASDESVDFAELFIGLSFFIVLSALLLTALLFLFAVEQRTQEAGLYLALGIPSAYVKRLILIEGALLAFMGCILGSILGVFYNQVILLGLETLWKDAVGTSNLDMHIDILTLFTGTIAAFVLALLTIWLVLRKEIRHPISTLQSGASKLQDIGSSGKSWLSVSIGLISVFSVLSILLTTDPGRGGAATGYFFSAGALLLIGGIAFANVFLIHSARKSEVATLNLRQIGMRNNARHKVRSLTLVGLLASGLFIVFMVGANRHGTLADPQDRSSGSGGFALFAETAIPLLHNLNSAEGQQFYALTDDTLSAARFVQFRVKEGDDASCLNLNRVSNPHLLGVDPSELAQRRAFTFTKLSVQANAEEPWLSLDQNFGQVTPGIADETVIIWGLGKSVGDTLEYVDETGRQFKIKLIGGLAKVENTYLSIFLILGGFGMILGTVGIGIIVLRNILERRNELALLRALGYNRKSIFTLLLSEHFLLLIMAVICGVSAAVIAVLPALLSPGTDVPYLTILAILLIVIISAALWTITATSFATRGDLLPALRNE
jgi:putative ABC transport system permease protein